MSPVQSSRPLVEFFFDCSCPWSYLAFGRLREAAIRTGAAIRYRPLLVDEFLAASNPAGARDRDDPLAARARYRTKDLADWARFCGLRIRRPALWPIRAEWAARGAIAAARQGQAPAYLEAVFAACFSKGQAITDWPVLLELARAAGLDSARLDQDARDTAVLREVQDNGTQLAERGGFGVPSFFVGDDLYFGNDRMPLVEAALAHRSGMRLTLPGEHG